ncbi:M24 family metallopeptidase [Kiloniella majae]|uniref:M24 family metallopeptidase n=1 Tax=Kiloniella majae TaxID=1938558 RepID=UPI000A277A48|nr:Xaa-Pro peptidase family protein [Kiloniella majae]
MSDFDLVEYQNRLSLAQKAMHENNLDALVFCTEAEVRYFTGFRTLFWQSPTRPWFLVVPQKGKPIAVIPAIGADLMQKTWVKDIRTWSSPHPTDDGISLLAKALNDYSRIGWPMGPETSLRLPVRDFDALRSSCRAKFIDCTDLLKALRMVKSEAELKIISSICDIGSSAFARAGELFSSGQALDDVFRQFKIALLQEGAEDVPYLVGAAGQGGYSDVISPPSQTPLRDGDVLMLDTGSTLKGYFCDFDRNFAISNADDAAKRGYEKLWQATEVGLKYARSGTRCSDLFNAMHETMGGGSSDVGRYGHGLGMQLTEWPSIYAHDHTVLKPGMVMTLEPSMEISPGKIMVHEENILITEDAPVLLTQRAAPELPII